MTVFEARLIVGGDVDTRPGVWPDRPEPNEIIVLEHNAEISRYPRLTRIKSGSGVEEILDWSMVRGKGEESREAGEDMGADKDSRKGGRASKRESETIEKFPGGNRTGPILSSSSLRGGGPSENGRNSSCHLRDSKFFTF